MKENIAIGVDIESIDRFKGLDRVENASFLNNIFTKNELDYSFSKEDAASHLAARYVGKEAVIKALYGLGSSAHYSEIEIIHNKTGVPFVKLKKDNFDDAKIKITLSHCEDKALAFVIILL